VYILFGQSNMLGIAVPESPDLVTPPHVEVLTLVECPNQQIGEWLPAQPALHGCVGGPFYVDGPGLGPGDYFGRAMAEAYPNDTILLVPNALPSLSIDDYERGKPAYQELLERSQFAQQRGTIEGLLMHQGESDTAEGTWPARVQVVIANLKADLGVDDVPLLVGQMPVGGCCDSHNPRIAELPALIPNTHIVSSAGLGMLDGIHFDAPSVRTFGTRYAEKMLEVD
jgi:hypothetical protein